jgi:hypothetical protein
MRCGRRLEQVGDLAQAAAPASRGDMAAAARRRKTRCNVDVDIWLSRAICTAPPEGVRTFASFRPGGMAPCEHMFPSLRTSPLAKRSLDALRLARSFLLLEDDHDVDWEVDQDEPSPPPHPHRAPLRSRAPTRRPGGSRPARHVCLSPVVHGRAGLTAGRGSGRGGGRVDDGSPALRR